MQYDFLKPFPELYDSLMKKPLLLLLSAGAFATVAASHAATHEPPATSATPGGDATLNQIREVAMNSDWALTHLQALTDEIGPRLSGSPQNAAAVTQIADAMRALGARVQVQPVKVPHWERGEEHAVLVDYPGHPAGITQAIHLTALGFSGATPVKGLSARVIVVHSVDELQAQAADVRGNIVLFEVRFDQRQADNGEADVAYSQAGAFRFTGPAAAASLGAAAALVRSIGGADYRLPHTGATVWKDNQTPIPAAALAAEDADLIARLAARGPVTMKLLLTPRTLPDADGANVIADWPGTERPDEYVVVSGHLDSWDLGTGATDDGVGMLAAAGVIDVMRQLNLHARRTIRFIGWANEENGGRGSKGYFDALQKNVSSIGAGVQSQVGAIESDTGGGRSMGLYAGVSVADLAALKPVATALAPIGATALERRDGELGADIAPLQQAGVAGFAPLVDARHYFDYHHTAADTFDKIDPVNLKTQVATMAVLSYFLADAPSPITGVKMPAE
jgi:carboxypeptidase Q